MQPFKSGTLVIPTNQPHTLRFRERQGQNKDQYFVVDLWMIRGAVATSFLFKSFFFFFSFLGPHLWHMKVLRLGVELELQLSAHTTAMQCQI